MNKLNYKLEDGKNLKIKKHRNEILQRKDEHIISQSN